MDDCHETVGRDDGLGVGRSGRSLRIAELKLCAERIRLRAAVSGRRLFVAAGSVVWPLSGPTEFGVVALHHSRRVRSVEAGHRRRGIEIMKNTPTNLELTSEIIPIAPPILRRVGRFQVTVESAAGVCISGGFTDSPEEAVEAFMTKAPSHEEGEISLFDREERRVVASVKWKMGATEIGLRVLHRQNVFHDWHLALIACEVQKRRSVQAAVELIA